MEAVKVVVRYTSGMVLKGTTADFFPNKTMFHLDMGAAEGPIEIQIQELKAVFWVKDFAGDSAYNEKKAFDPGAVPAGRKAEVTFKDGEVLIGTTLGYDPKRLGFFITVADPKSNNIRMYAVSTAVRSVRFL